MDCVQEGSFAITIHLSSDEMQSTRYSCRYSEQMRPNSESVQAAEKVVSAEGIEPSTY
jgi:hypothetical protein